jgi:hypothetical protein
MKQKKKKKKKKNLGIFYISLASLSQRRGRHLSQLHLPDLSAAGDGHRAGHPFFTKYKHVLRCLVPTESLSRPRPEVVIRGPGLTRGDLDEGTDHFAVPLVGNADNGGQVDFRVCRQALFDLEGVDVFAAYTSQFGNKKYWKEGRDGDVD